jgi:NAD-dependent deacetylase
MMVSPIDELNKAINLAARLIRHANYTVALTGAGISTPSGIPDFRSPGSGVWTKYSPMDVASLSAFRYHPDRFYNWLRPFAKVMFEADPNPAHESLANLEQEGFLKSIITQNIDALHQKSGSRNVIEVHGTCRTLSCSACFEQVEADINLLQTLLEMASIPLCPKCNTTLKPDIILYEEQLPVETWNQARKEIRSCDLLLVLGSSLTVTPTSDLPIAALAQGAKLIIINQGSTHLDTQAEVTLKGDLADLLPAIKQKVIYEKS